MTHQEIIDAISRANREYGDRMDMATGARTAAMQGIQADCGKVGHICKTTREPVQCRGWVDVRRCVVCAKVELPPD